MTADRQAFVPGTGKADLRPADNEPKVGGRPVPLDALIDALGRAAERSAGKSRRDADPGSTDEGL